jgi:hypothetical protein
MKILLAFAPFIAFVIIERLVSVPVGLAAGAVVSAILILSDLRKGNRQIKILEGGTFILFAGLTVYAFSVGGATWPIAAVRLCVDGGLLLIVLASIALRRPFTLQYARESATPAQWNNPAFIRANYIITAAWAAAFAVMVVADLILVYLPNLPHSIAIVATILALYSAMKFTTWYPSRASATTHHPI